MPRGGAHFSSEELAEVLSHYDIGPVHQARPLPAGSRHAAKMVILSERGGYLLKSRPKGKGDLNRVAFAHAVQTHLAQRDFPVTSLMVTRDKKNTIVQLHDRIYELYGFVTGIRYDGSVEATIDAGRQLAKLHRHMAGFTPQWQPGGGSFHDSSIVRRHLKSAGSEKSARPNRKLQETASALMSLYNAASIHVNELGFDSWAEQVVHGDWHPGNMLFSGRRLIAVLDFDSVRIAPAITDLANGMVQFSIVAGRPNPADWPAYPDEAKLAQFLDGYRDEVELEKNELDSLLDLMIETMVAEAILPIAATGLFEHLSGLDFLKMIQRKCQWIDRHRKRLTEAIGP
ncbi:MAG: phosphotransferase enzyme family protein [Planctomycetota bacterium]|jgi:Ser/Thr protein kinase RdoA (MazF antagonist)